MIPIKFTSNTDGQRVLVSCRTVSARRGRFTLGPVTCDFAVGSTVLVGPNGAGKTTLLRLLTGLATPQSGEIVWATHTAVGESLAGVRGNSVGYLPQDPDSPSITSLVDFLHMAAWLRGISRASREHAVQQALTIVDLTDRGRSSMGSLSGGQRRRAGLAAALVHRPQVLVLDEPMTGLDPQQRIRLRGILAGIAAERAVITSTHVLADVGAATGRVLVMADGRVVYDGSREGLADRAASQGVDTSALVGDTDLERGLSAVLAEARP